jgi:SAM-dependent methyltransferase
MGNVARNKYSATDVIADRVRLGKHREAVGGRWEEIGGLQLDFLSKRGLKPEHFLLDVGCGSLRAGVKLVPYLEPGHYFGIDLNQSLLDAGYDCELIPAGLAGRLPRTNLARTDSFDAAGFGRRFHFAIAQSVFTHVPWNDVRLCLEKLCDVMEDGGSFFASYFELSETEPSRRPIKHGSGGVETYSNRDPYHYRISDFWHACRGLPWRICWHGDWGHPRGQKMIWFQYEAKRAFKADHPGPRSTDPADADRLRAGADHYRAYVGPPERFDFMSASQFALLFQLGLRDTHRVLDFGCGSLRLGRLLIPFLRKGGYFGVEPNAWLVDDGIRAELGHDAVLLKEPRFSYNDAWRCDVFDTTFDYVVAQSIFTHTGPDLAKRLANEFASVLRPDGLLALSFIMAEPGTKSADRLGWIYPACVPYTRDMMMGILQGAGLHAALIPWHHPGATWLVAAKDPKRLPAAERLSNLA